jgi:putative heme-binding domain-containing protein
MQWIWFDEGDPLASAPAETRYFRRVFDLDRPGGNALRSASLEITADNSFTVFVNGARVGSGDSWSSLYRFDVRAQLVNGKNVLAVAAHNEGGPAGLVVRLRCTVAGKKPLAVVSDGAWKVSKAPVKDWQSLRFDDSKWSKARVLGPFGKLGPWGSGAAAPGKRVPVRFTVPEGFKVERAVAEPSDRGPFSLVNMTFDGRGRLLLSQEGGPILVCGKPDKDGVFGEVSDYCTLVRNCHGMVWVKDSLYLVGDGPKGTGVYRCRDTKGAGRIDEATLLHRTNGGMGEHGPHALAHGPDGMLYFVLGNHAFVRIGPKLAPNPEKLAANSPLVRWPTGGMGPDQGRPGTTEDVLLPRLNDANGHAANILAPGGTIWRMGLDGKDMALVAAGFRNHFDAAFSPAGELFTFDSDMEWDIGLPWYRAVRASHCPPGSDFVWRTGAANTPSYYIDSLPPLHETGRGSPVGVTFYDHHRYGPKYRGAFLMADWSLGIIYAVHLKRKGATYTPEVEKFCTGTPLNVTDLEVAPDGAVYFTMGGRGTHGGVYRIVPTSAGTTAPEAASAVERVLALEQPLSAWSRARAEKIFSESRKEVVAGLLAKAQSTKAPASQRIRALTLLHLHGSTPPREGLVKLLSDGDADVRAQAVYLLPLAAPSACKEELVRCLADRDALVRRRACEALIRAGAEPPVEAVWPLLSEEDRFVRTAARLVLQRIDASKWLPRMEKESKDLIAWEAIVALCKTGQVEANLDRILARLNQPAPTGVQPLLDWVRVVQLVCCQTGKAPAPLAEIGKACLALFPHADRMVNRELAILLAHLRRTGVIDAPVHAALLDAMKASTGDREQQIHYFYCLRLLHDGWTKEQKAALIDWYEQTRAWSGGNSFTPFLANIFRDALGAFDVADRKAILADGAHKPLTSLALAGRLANDRQPELLPELKKLAAVAGKTSLPRGSELQRALSEAILRTACEHPKAEYYADLLGGLSSPNKLIVFDTLAALTKVPARPKPDDPTAFRAVLLASRKLDASNRWKAVELLRHWTDNKQFGADKGQWKPELEAWSRWFGQTFPKEPALPDVEGDRPTPSKYAYADLLDYLTRGEGQKGDAKRGRTVFEKALCLKCHKYGKEGEGIGPDLTTLVKRFKRADVLESIYYPSKVISDQYRSTTIVTLKGQRIEGLAAVQGDMITVLQSDGSKVTLRKKDIEQQFASLVSVMPEKLLDPLTRAEIADLFAFLESEPAK